MARFFVDESLPTLLAEELVKVGHEAVHAHEAGLQGAPDERSISGQMPWARYS
jgi:predicted nuclease of predicted toxin-antitoxin system